MIKKILRKIYGFLLSLTFDQALFLVAVLFMVFLNSFCIFWFMSILSDIMMIGGL